MELFFASAMIEIVTASIENLLHVVPLFDQYRVFYNQESNIEGAKAFLKERFRKNDSMIFLAYCSDEPVGFTQLYPLFSSVSMQRSYVLNDLFVHPDFRKKQIGEALLNRAKKFCLDNKAKGLALETAIDNPAQRLYEKLDWVKDVDSFHYFWTAQ
ncbi:MAG: GNAT family N-acetyltransferase [Maribacter sp.]|uniref:GNAT family N-acetyltransferase n=1 Tax=Maribacter sp. TaxID=1897614 RepID=UPI003C72A231